MADNEQLGAPAEPAEAAAPAAAPEAPAPAAAAPAAAPEAAAPPAEPEAPAEPPAEPVAAAAEPATEAPAPPTEEPTPPAVETEPVPAEPEPAPEPPAEPEPPPPEPEAPPEIVVPEEAVIGFTAIQSDVIPHTEIESALTQARKQFMEIAGKSGGGASTEEIKFIAKMVFEQLIRKMPGKAEEQKKEDAIDKLMTSFESPTGTWTADQFDGWFRSIVEQAETYGLSLSKAISDGYDESAAAKKFRQFDMNNDGFIEGKELDKLAEWVYTSFRPDAAPMTAEQKASEITKLLKRLDEASGNGDGKISFEEFHAYFDEKIKQIALFEENRAKRAVDKEWKAKKRAEQKKPAAGVTSCYEKLFEMLPPALVRVAVCLPIPPQYGERSEAAVKLQKIQKGRAERRAIEEKKKAASKIAAAQKGKQVRDQVTTGGAATAGKPKPAGLSLSIGSDGKPKAAGVSPAPAPAKAGGPLKAGAPAPSMGGAPAGEEKKKTKGFMSGMFSGRKESAPLKERPSARGEAAAPSSDEGGEGAAVKAPKGPPAPRDMYGRVIDKSTHKPQGRMIPSPLRARKSSEELDMYGRPLDKSSHKGDDVAKGKRVMSGSFAPSKFVRGVSPPRWLDRDVDKAMGKEVKL